MENINEGIKGFLTNDEYMVWKERLENTLLINQYRLKVNRNFTLDQRKNESSICGSLCLNETDLPGEIWKDYPHNRKYTISSYGRVRYENNIVPQKDKDGKVGYLILDDSEYDEKLLTYCIYQLVAYTFFERPQEDGCHIHHISNNGYDNSIGNLIYLTEDQHYQIHDSEKRLKEWES